MIEYKTLQIDFRIPYKIEHNNYSVRDDYTFYSASGQREVISYSNYRDIEKFYSDYKCGIYKGNPVMSIIIDSIYNYLPMGIDPYEIKTELVKTVNKKLLLI